jgi:hypothetical protein
VTVSNPYDAAVESVSVRIGLPGADGEPRQSQDVPALLNVLPASSRFPLAAYFSPPLPDGYQPSVELLTALPVSDGSRYLSVRLQDLRTTIQPDGLGAQVDGKAWLDEAVDEGAVLWLGVAAYDRQERPLGIRKLEITAPPGNARGFPFKGTVYSAGGEIHRVDVLAEARR